MTTQTNQSAEVRTSVQVGAAPDRAFEVFTAGFDRWWPRSHHLLPGELKRAGAEPFVGGRMWEENDSGETCTWGRVLTWDPPRVFAFSWMIGADFAVPAEDAPASRVTVTFTAVDGGTRVDLVHDRLDAHGEGWAGVRRAVGADGGWPGILRAYAAAV